MYPASRKLELVETILSIRNDKSLKEIEEILNKFKVGNNKNKTSAKDFSGIWNDEESKRIEEVIEEGCEKINPDDWK